MYLKVSVAKYAKSYVFPSQAFLSNRLYDSWLVLAMYF